MDPLLSYSPVTSPEPPEEPLEEPPGEEMADESTLADITISARKADTSLPLSGASDDRYCDRK